MDRFLTRKNLGKLLRGTGALTWLTLGMRRTSDSKDRSNLKNDLTKGLRVSGIHIIFRSGGDKGCFKKWSWKLSRDHILKGLKYWVKEFELPNAILRIFWERMWHDHLWFSGLAVQWNLGIHWSSSGEVVRNCTTFIQVFEEHHWGGNMWHLIECGGWGVKASIVSQREEAAAVNQKKEDSESTRFDRKGWVALDAAQLWGPAHHPCSMSPGIQRLWKFGSYLHRDKGWIHGGRFSLGASLSSGALLEKECLVTWNLLHCIFSLNSHTNMNGDYWMHATLWIFFVEYIRCLDLLLICCSCSGERLTVWPSCTLSMIVNLSTRQEHCRHQA